MIQPLLNGRGVTVTGRSVYISEVKSDIHASITRKHSSLKVRLIFNNAIFNVSLGRAIFGQGEAEEALKKIYSWMQRRRETVTELGKEHDLPHVGSQDRRREKREGRGKAGKVAGFKMSCTVPIHFILQQICENISHFTSKKMDSWI